MLPSILLAVVALFFMIKWWLETKKTKSLNKEVLAQKNELGLNKDFSDAILRNIDAYIVLANRNFLVEKTNYYSLNSERMTVFFTGWGNCFGAKMRWIPVHAALTRIVNPVRCVLPSKGVFAKKTAFPGWKLR